MLYAAGVQFSLTPAESENFDEKADDVGMAVDNFDGHFSARGGESDSPAKGMVKKPQRRKPSDRPSHCGEFGPEAGGNITDPDIECPGLLLEAKDRFQIIFLHGGE